MLEGFLIGAIAVGLLACPLMMWLGRRGIGPGCGMSGRAEEREEPLADLRRRQRELEEQIARLEAANEPATRGRD